MIRAISLKSKSAGGAGGMTIEELAQRSGVTTRNIRAYQTKGLLPPPEVRPGGRTGFYQASHLARLRLIANLQDSGHSLAGVASLLSAWEAGHTLEQMLGLGEVVESTRPRGIEFVSREQLAERLPKALGTRRVIAALLHAGVLQRHERGYKIRHPEALAFASEIVRAGIPVPVLLDDLPRITAGLSVIAERLVAHYRHYVADPYFDAGLPMAQLPQMQTQLKMLHGLAQGFLTSMMSEALDREIEALTRRLLMEKTAG